MYASSLTSERRSFSLKLWPPSENTRLMLVERITKNLNSESMFINKYGRLSQEEAEESARQIEDEAFNTASQRYEKEPDEDGVSAVQLYAKKCSKLVVEVLKGRPRCKAAVQNGASVAHGNLFDISKGQRAFIEAEEAEELLKPLKEPGNAYTKICFSNRSFGLGAACIAGHILLSLKDQLKDVDLSGFIAGRPGAEALQVMSIFSAVLEGSVLKSLNLSNNALGEKGVRAFGSLLKSQTQLEELYLMNDGISKEAACAVSELIPSTETLKVLHFHNDMTGDEGALAIAKVVERSPLLGNFCCSSTRIGSDGGIALAEALENCAHLGKLDLRDNMFGVEGGLGLSRALSKHSDLAEVYLSYLNLEDEGAIAIANVLREKAPSLKVLEMARNDITAEAAPTLAACVASMESLAKLNLSENELKDEGTILVAKSLGEGHDKLEEVDFSTNSIRRAGARCLAQVVVHKSEFKLLNINGNFISEEGVDEIKNIFKKCPGMLGPLDENDSEGEDEDVEDDAENGDDGDELESKMNNLKLGQEDRGISSPRGTLN